MKMKNYITPFAALIFIGLLVITGCQGLFEPPTRSGSGNGTLFVSINNDDGRTILPPARLDKYVLTITPTGGTAGEPLDTSGSTALVLAAGEYTVKVDGYVDGVIIATGTDTATVPAGGTTSISVLLEPKATGKGTFSWDFDVELVTKAEINIYDIDDDSETIEDSTQKSGDIELEAGVYDVEFKITADGKDYVWREILYIYAGLTSVFGNSDLVAREVLPTIPYVVPAAGKGYFYLDLNNWKDVTDLGTGINNNVPKATTAVDSLTVNYTEENQRVSIKLTDNQAALVAASKSPIKIAVTGSAGSSTTNFRYHLGKIDTGSGWNATGDFGGSNTSIATLVDGTPRETEFTGNKSDAASVAYFILQQRAAASTTVTINSIRIEYTLDIDGEFDLDVTLANKLAAGTAVQDYNGLASVTGAVAAFPATSGTRLVFPLTAAQIKILQGVAADPDATPPVAAAAAAETVYITIEGTASADALFRYHLGFLNSNSGWNATGGTAGNQQPFSNLVSADGTTIALGLSNPERLTDPGNTNSGTGDDPNDDLATPQGGFLILQLREAKATNVTITGINIAYKLKDVWIAPPAAEEDLEVITAADPVTIDGPWGQWGDIEVPLTITWPTGLKPGSYVGFTLKMEAFDASDASLDLSDNIQFWFTSASTQYYQNRLGLADFANGRNLDAYEGELFVQGELRAETIGGIYAQPKTANVAKVVITELTLLAAIEEEEYEPPFEIDEIDGGIELGVAGDVEPELSTDGTVVTVIGDSSTAFTVLFSNADYTYDADHEITITYAAVIWPGDPAKVILKQGVGLDSSTTKDVVFEAQYGQYKTLEEGESKTIVIPAGGFPDDATGITFQHNVDGAADAKYMVKILSITGE